MRTTRDFLAPGEPVRPPEWFTLEGQQRSIDKLLGLHDLGGCLPHVIMCDGELVGRITFNEVVRGPFDSCHLGYWVGGAWNGRGVATAAVAEMAQLAFDDLGLHRIQAGTLLHNVASQRVLERNGFVRFGVAPSYLRIAGAWQDHALYQLLSPSGRPSSG